MSSRLLQSVRPAETLEIGTGLSLVPRVKLLLTIYRSDLSVKPIDEWKLKRSLIDFLKNSLPVPLVVPEEDLDIRRFKDLKKRKREDPVASGILYIRDLGFLTKNNKKKENSVHEKEKEDEEEEDVKVLEKKFFEWKKSVVEKLDGIELNIEGMKFRLNVSVPPSDDFEGLKKAWEEFFAFENRGYYSRSGRQQPDTLVLRGAPSRWFAEPRVSSKPSMLVTHTIFSFFGKIRNLNVAEDDDPGKIAGEDGVDIVSGLQCKIVVQFEKFDDFCNAIKVLSGRSMQKQGSRLKADYEVTWDKNGYFRNIQQKDLRSQINEKNSQRQAMAAGHHTQISRSDGVRPKRFKD